MDKDLVKRLLEKELNTKVTPRDDFGILGNMPMEERLELTKWDLVVKQMVNKAINGDNKSMQEILDRLIGKPQLEIKQDINVTNYTTFLENLAQLPDAKLPPPTTVDVEPTPLPPPEAVEELTDDFGLSDD